jgi:hypothetical protein
MEPVGDVSDKKKLTDITETLIFCTMYIGMAEITEKNYLEFYTRLSIYERVMGNFLYNGNGETRTPRYFTIQDIKQHIGLQTNASPLTKTQFTKDLYTRHERAVKEESRKVEKEAKVIA